MYHSLDSMERTLKRWEEELLTPNKTVLKPADVKRLKKMIDKVYLLESKTQQFIDKCGEFIEKDRGC